MFKPGDYVIRTVEDWRDCKVGETYEVLEIINYGFDIESLVLKGMPAKYAACNFVLSPISGSPLIKALS